MLTITSYNTASKWEADVAKKLLEDAGIAAVVMDREDSGTYSDEV